MKQTGPAICPECAQGKHANCDGTAWDLTSDDYTICSCPAPDHAQGPAQRLSCGCLLVVASRTLLESCEQHHAALGPVSVEPEE
jgi:hypothetical protein